MDKARTSLEKTLSAFGLKHQTMSHHLK
jgi:hypothetical protein